MKAVILARVSTLEQIEDGQSVPAQLLRAREYSEKKGLVIYKEYSFDESSLKDHRKKFEQIIDEIKKSKEIIALVAETIDRVQRSFKESVLLLELIKQGKVEVHFIRENLIINNNSNSSEFIRWDMGVMFARSYVLNISDNVKRTFELKRRNGEWTGRVRVGYLPVMQDLEKRLRRDIIIDSQRGHLVQKMFELYTTGNYSLKKLQIEITKLGLTSINGKVLQKSNIDNILKDSFYCGMAMSHKYGLYPHNYPRLISKEVFDKCQEIRKDRTIKKTKEVSKEFLFKGLLKCHNCGCSMTPELQKGNVYYSCTNAKGACKRVYVNEKSLIKPIYERALDKFESISEKTVEDLLNELRKNVEVEKVFHNQQIKRIQAEYEQSSTMDARLLDVFLTESITEDTYNKKHQELQDKMQRLLIEQAEHQNADNNYQTTIASVISVSKRAKSIFENSSDMAGKRAFLKILLQNPTVNGKELCFTIASPFNLVLQLATCPFWLPDKDSNLFKKVLESFKLFVICTPFNGHSLNPEPCLL